MPSSVGTHVVGLDVKTHCVLPLFGWEPVGHGGVDIGSGFVQSWLWSCDLSVLTSGPVIWETTKLLKRSTTLARMPPQIWTTLESMVAFTTALFVSIIE